MTIQYALRRRDIWDAYWFIWRNGWTLKIVQLIIAASVFYLVLAWRSSVIVASIAAVISIVWLPVYPLLRYKPQLRTLTISPAGIQTQIANKSRELAWTEINRMTRNGDRLYLIGHTGNSFVVPDHAFATAEERNAFEEQARNWCKAAG